VGDTGFGRGKDNPQDYDYEQIRVLLAEIGVHVVAEAKNNFLCYCPWHGNRDTPAFSVNYENGLYMCWNPSCGESGNIFMLLRKMLNCNDFEAMRLIQKCGKESEQSFEERFQRSMEKADEWAEFPTARLDSLHREMWSRPEGRDYMEGRGFTDETIEHFRVGYSHAMGMVAIPVHNPVGLPVGIVGRSVKGKEFKNSPKMPTTRTLFNLHRAKKIGDIAIVTESSFDTMRLHQAGFPNAVGTLGGYMSPDRYALLDRSFSTIIIMTDNDKLQYYDGCKKHFPEKCAGHNPGRELGMNIASTLKHKNILWATYEPLMIYPHDAKDATDLTDTEIRQCVNNSVTHFEYLSWRLDAKTQSVVQ
jgi:hypothetical protein